MVSLIPIFFLCDLPAIDQALNIIPPETFLAFKIYSKNLAGHTSILKNLNTVNHAHFCVALDLSAETEWTTQNEIDNFADDLASITFQQNYFFRRPLYPTFALTGTTIPENFVGALTTRMQLHGYDGLDFLLYNKGDWSHSSGIEKQNAHFISEKENVEEQYTNLIQNKVNAGDVLLIAVQKHSDITPIMDIIDHVNERLKNSSPRFFELLQNGIKLNNRYFELYRNTVLLKEKLDLGIQFHASSSSPEAVYRQKILEIAKFYNYEYEILPLWYKRFGHIIKVVMGKRTFKSLYDDNVKKYNT